MFKRLDGLRVNGPEKGCILKPFNMHKPCPLSAQRIECAEKASLTHDELLQLQKQIDSFSSLLIPRWLCHNFFGVWLTFCVTSFASFFIFELTHTFTIGSIAFLSLNLLSAVMNAKRAAEKRTAIALKRYETYNFDIAEKTYFFLSSGRGSHYNFYLGCSSNGTRYDFEVTRSVYTKASDRLVVVVYDIGGKKYAEYFVPKS